MLKGLASDLTGSADICRSVKDFEKCLAFTYLVPGETIMFSLQSSKEEFTFTSQGMIKLEGETATTTRKLVERYDYKSNYISGVKFETAGRVDRDCEIKFTIGNKSVSIDIATSEEPEATVFYKVLELLGREQHSNARNWELTTTAIGHAASALRLTEASGVRLTALADEASTWMQEKYKQQQPRCYREFIAAALLNVRTGNKYT